MPENAFPLSDQALVAAALQFCAEDLTDGFGNHRLAQAVAGESYTDASCSKAADRLRQLARQPVAPTGMALIVEQLRDWARQEQDPGIRAGMLQVADDLEPDPEPEESDLLKTTIVVEVLSKGPFAFESLEEVHEAITDGDCSGSWTSSERRLTPSQMRTALAAQGSDEDFITSDRHVCPSCESEKCGFTPLPDTKTSVDLYEIECPSCGARGVYSYENQDGSHTFTPE